MQRLQVVDDVQLQGSGLVEHEQVDEELCLEFDDEQLEKVKDVDELEDVDEHEELKDELLDLRWDFTL